MSGLLTFSSLNYLFRIIQLALSVKINRKTCHAAGFGCILNYGFFSMGVPPEKIGELIRLWFLELIYHLPYVKTMALCDADNLAIVGVYIQLD